jgi:hypothetical protein
MSDSLYPGKSTTLGLSSLSSTELLVLRAALCRARTHSIREALGSRSPSQIWDMIRNVWEVDGLVDDVNYELARCLSIWPGSRASNGAALHIRGRRRRWKQWPVQARSTGARTHRGATRKAVAGPGCAANEPATPDETSLAAR